MTDIAADCKRGCDVADPHACCVAQIATTNFALKSMSIRCVGRRPNRLSCDFSTYPQVPVRTPCDGASRTRDGASWYPTVKVEEHRGCSGGIGAESRTWLTITRANAPRQPAWISVKTLPASPRLRRGFCLPSRSGRMSPESWLQRVPLPALVASIAILSPTLSEARDARHSSGMYRMSVEYPWQYRLRHTPFAATRRIGSGRTIADNRWRIRGH
jgi:hypothetical protein